MFILKYYFIILSGLIQYEWQVLRILSGFFMVKQAFLGWKGLFLLK